MQVNIAQAAVTAAQADLVPPRRRPAAIEGQTRSLRFNLDHAIEEVDNQIAMLRSKVATLESQEGALGQGAGRLRPGRAAGSIRRGLARGLDIRTRSPAGGPGAG